MFKRIKTGIDIAGSLVASTATAWRGTMVTTSRTGPMPALTLFDIEGDPRCRLVREALTELHLDCEILPCPQGGSRFKKQLSSVASQVAAPPVLQDRDLDAVLVGLEPCIGHLFKHYGDGDIPIAFAARGLQLHRLASHAATLARRGRGLRMRPSSAPQKPLELWSFESSPFSRRARERLCEMQIPYLLHNLGKEQIADLGVQWIRMKNPLTPYTPVPGGKRAEFLEQKGMVQVPFLFDPNTGQGLFESSAILEYLDEHYG